MYALSTSSKYRSKRTTFTWLRLRWILISVCNCQRLRVKQKSYNGLSGSVSIYLLSSSTLWQSTFGHYFDGILSLARQLDSKKALGESALQTKNVHSWLRDSLATKAILTLPNSFPTAYLMVTTLSPSLLRSSINSGMTWGASLTAWSLPAAPADGACCTVAIIE